MNLNGNLLTFNQVLGFSPTSDASFAAPRSREKRGGIVLFIIESMLTISRYSAEDDISASSCLFYFGDFPLFPRECIQSKETSKCISLTKLISY